MSQRSVSIAQHQGGIDESTPEIQRICKLLLQAQLELQDHHEIGRQLSLLAGDENGAGHGTGWRREAAKAVAKVLDEPFQDPPKKQATLNKCFQFFRSFTKDELQTIRAMNWKKITIALGIEDAAERLRVLRRAQKEGWSSRDLQREVQRLNGTWRGGGRPRHEVQSRGCLADLSESARISGLWMEFHAGVWCDSKASYVEELRQLRAESPESLAALLQHLEEAAERWKELGQICAESLSVASGLLEKLRPKKAPN